MLTRRSAKRHDAHHCRMDVGAAQTDVGERTVAQGHEVA
jgi:hypothetical protein